MQPRRRATPPESKLEEPTDSSDIESSSEEPTDSSNVEFDELEEPEESTDSSGVESSSEENSWELAAGDLSAAVAAAAVEEERGASLKSTDSSEAESRVLSPSEDEWEDLSQADCWSSMEAAVDAAAVTSAAEEVAAAECLNSVRILAIITERRHREDAVAAAAQEGRRHAGLLPGGQGGRGELEAGGTPRTFDHGKT